MQVKRILIQAGVGAILFTIISVILEGNYGQEIWIEKGIRGIVFGVLYGIFLVAREKFMKKR